MITRAQIVEYANEIASKFSPEKIILFGSQATGNASEDSDVDLLVVMDFQGKGMRQSNLIRTSIPHRFPLDILVRRSVDLKWRVAEGDYLLQDILQGGVVLYEAPH